MKFKTCFTLLFISVLLASCSDSDSDNSNETLTSTDDDQLPMFKWVFPNEEVTVINAADNVQVLILDNVQLSYSKMSVKNSIGDTIITEERIYESWTADVVMWVNDDITLFDGSYNLEIEVEDRNGNISSGNLAFDVIE